MTGERPYIFLDGIIQAMQVIIGVVLFSKTYYFITGKHIRFPFKRKGSLHGINET
jgi:hypothetical protein